jgi:hypothetical protein
MRFEFRTELSNEDFVNLYILYRTLHHIKKNCKYESDVIQETLSEIA